MIGSLSVDRLVLSIGETLVIIHETVEATEMLALGVTAKAEVAEDNEGEEDGESNAHPFDGVGVIDNVAFEFGVAEICGFAVIHVGEDVDEVIGALAPSRTTEGVLDGSEGLGE